MRKFYVLLITLLATSVAFGQSLNPMQAGRKLDDKHIAKFKPHHNNAKNESRWYNYGEAMDVVLGGVAEYNANYLFPDSTMLVNYVGGVVAGTWLHKLADVLDVTSTIFNDAGFFPGMMYLTSTDQYQLDTIEIYGVYLRGPMSPNAVDTLLVEVAIKNAPGGYSYFGPTSPVSINLGTDTTAFVDLPYQQSTNHFGVSGHFNYKVPMDVAFAADTVPGGLNIIRVLPNKIANANQLVYCSVSFIPGYTWNPNTDSMISYNRFRFLSLDENPGQFPLYTKWDWNVSYILPLDVRYNQAGGWNGSYIPSFAYMGGSTNTYSYIHHAIYYKIMGPPVGINENIADGSLLGDAYPNPAGHQGDMIIPVSSEAIGSILTITDILGNDIISYNDFTDGRVIVNTSNLRSGMYFYTLKNGDKKTSRKFVVTE